MNKKINMHTTHFITKASKKVSFHFMISFYPELKVYVDEESFPLAFEVACIDGMDLISAFYEGKNRIFLDLDWMINTSFTDSENKIALQNMKDEVLLELKKRGIFQEAEKRISQQPVG